MRNGPSCSVIVVISHANGHKRLTTSPKTRRLHMSNDVRYIYDSRMHENVATLDPRRMGVNVRL